MSHTPLPQLPPDKKIEKFDLLSGFPPTSIYQLLCRHREGRATTNVSVTAEDLREILTDTRLVDLQLLGGERVTVRYLE